VTVKRGLIEVLGATIQRCRVHFMRNALACAGKKDKAIVTAALRTAFEAGSLKVAKEKWSKLIEAFEPRYPKLAELMVRAEEDVLAYKAFPQAHWQQIHSTNPLERLNKEIKRRTNVIGIFPNEAAITRLVGALMLEQNDEWAITRRYMGLETVRELCNDAILDAAQIASNRLNPAGDQNLHHFPGHYLGRRSVCHRKRRHHGFLLTIRHVDVPWAWSLP
jgi:hypothetical protein